jgi:o-succinylbenzoate synthase
LKLENVVLRPYALPLKTPWRAARATLFQRRGALVGVFAENFAGWGDCAPLPSSGEPGFAQASAALDQAAENLRGATLDDAFAGLAAVEHAQARWAVETALLDLFSREKQQPLHRALGGAPVGRLPVNAAVGPLDQGCGARLAAALAEGFRFVKIKVGVRAWAEELRCLRGLSGLGQARLRLDANRAWSEDEAKSFLDGVADLPIDAVEEPLARPTLASLRRLQARYAFALAVDESLFELGPENLFAARAVRRLVIKPARIGGFGETMRLARAAGAAGMEAVITSVVDSAIGVAAAAQLAAAIAPGRAHGLATGSWLARDVAAPSPLRDGALILPETPGLGLAPAGEFAQF